MNIRKDDHVNHALSHFNPVSTNDFDQIRFVHHSLRAIDVSGVSLETTVGPLHLATPFYINAMTGGTEWTKEINRKLATVAREAGLAMATGSMSAAFKDPSVWDSFAIVREVNPDGILFANLNPNYGLDEARVAVARIGAAALQIHINSPQEVVMPEGDRNFSHWSENIRRITAGLNVPVIVKEVGFGMSGETIEQLQELGVRHIDVSGRGGTNFARIENDRREAHKLDYLNNWGQSTVQSLLEARPYRDRTELIASGGMRHPLDMIKAFALGAKAVGMSAGMLNMVMELGIDETVQRIAQWREDLRLLMALLGASRIEDLRGADLILSPDLMNYCENRGLSTTKAR